MGTRSTVRFYSEHDQKTPILSVYGQFDGYISGLGYRLANWLSTKKICNGFNGSQSIENGWANGMGCLAAQYVKDHKNRIGGLYITSHNDEQEYNYEIRFVDGKFIIKVGEFEGTPSDLLKYKEPIED